MGSYNFKFWAKTLASLFLLLACTGKIPGVFAQELNDSVYTVLEVRTDESIVVNANARDNDDFYFHGWATSSNGEIVYPAYNEFTLDDDSTLYAVFGTEQLNGKLDVNIRVNGSYRGNSNNVATFDVYLADGTPVKKGATDLYKQFPAGTGFIIENIQAEEGYFFTGISTVNSYSGCVKNAKLTQMNEVEGFISSSGITEVVLSFASSDYLGKNANMAKVEPNEINTFINKGEHVIYDVNGRNNDSQVISGWQAETEGSSVYIPVWNDVQYLDLNARINSRFKGNSEDKAKFDVFINNQLAARAVNDYYKKWPIGYTYNIVPVETASGYEISGADNKPSSSSCVYGGGMNGRVREEKTEVTVLINKESVGLIRYLNDDENTVFNERIAKNEDYTIPKVTAKRDGYLFAGWAYEDGGEVKVANGGKINTAEDVTLYGIWQKVNYVDVNGMILGKYSSNLNNYATFDVLVDGVKVVDDTSDFYRAYPVGSSIKIDDIKAADKYQYNGLSDRKSYKGVSHQNSLEFVLDDNGINDVVLIVDKAPDPTLAAHFKVVDGMVKEVVSGKEIPSATVSEDGVHFTGDGTTGISIGGNHYNITIEAIVDFDENNMTQAKTVYSTYDGVYGKTNSFTLVKNSNSSFGIKANRLAVEPYQSNLITVNSTFVNEETGTNEYENLTTGDTFVALSGDVSNMTTIGQVNGAQSVNTLKSVASYYRTAYGTIYFNNYHQIKELKIYKSARTAEQLMEDYQDSGLSSTVTSTITGADGLVGLGSPSAWYFDDNNNVVWDDDVLVKAPGVYRAYTTDGTVKNFAIAEYDVSPSSAVDNSVYESIHITNKIDEIILGKQYSLTAYPYPFTGSENFDVIWSSSDNDIVRVVDGLIVAEDTGEATITATLRGTDIRDSFTLSVVEKPYIEDAVYTVAEDYVSQEGYAINDDDRQVSMRAVYAAIDEAHANGYTHVYFPFAVYASAIEKDLPVWYVPSNTTIEFEELHMVYQPYMAQNHQLHTFEFGVPADNYDDVCENSNLLIHNYYGERYDEFAQTGAVTEGNYIEELRFVQFGRKAFNCSVQIENAQYPAGYFITVDGTGRVDSVNGVITYDNMVSGRLTDDGAIESDTNWISSQNLISVPESVKHDGFFISNDGQSSYAAKYRRGCTARLMDIQWYDSEGSIIETERFLGTAEYYKAPEGAEFFKISLQQNYLPTPSGGDSAESAWLAMHDDGSAKFCEIKNTNVYNSATGMFSVVGESDGLWIHNNYISQNGTKPGDERTGDLENGWHMMRHTVISKNVMSGSSFTAFASGGIGTIIHTNYFGNEIYTRPEDEQTRIINNRGTSWILSVNDAMDFYYNNNYSFYFNSSNSSLKGWKCSGNLHYNYNAGGWLNRN